MPALNLTLENTFFLHIVFRPLFRLAGSVSPYVYESPLLFDKSIE